MAESFDVDEKVVMEPRWVESDALERLEELAFESGIYETEKEMWEDGYRSVLCVLIRNITTENSDSKSNNNRSYDRGYNT